MIKGDSNPNILIGPPVTNYICGTPAYIDLEVVPKTSIMRLSHPRPFPPTAREFFWVPVKAKFMR